MKLKNIILCFSMVVIGPMGTVYGLSDLPNQCHRHLDFKPCTAKARVSMFRPLPTSSFDPTHVKIQITYEPKEDCAFIVVNTPRRFPYLGHHMGKLYGAWYSGGRGLIELDFPSVDEFKIYGLRCTISYTDEEERERKRLEEERERQRLEEERERQALEKERERQELEEERRQLAMEDERERRRLARRRREQQRVREETERKEREQLAMTYEHERRKLREQLAQELIEQQRLLTERRLRAQSQSDSDAAAAAGLLKGFLEGAMEMKRGGNAGTAILKGLESVFEESTSTGATAHGSTGQDLGGRDPHGCLPLPPACEKAGWEAGARIRRWRNAPGMSQGTRAVYCMYQIGIEHNNFCARVYRSRGKTQCAKLYAQQASLYRNALPQLRQRFESVTAGGGGRLTCD